MTLLSRLRACALGLAAALTGAVPGHAQEEPPQINNWGIEHEKPVVYSGTIVDLVCELTGGADCAANCGDGRRQLGILVADTGALLPITKGATLFANGHDDMILHCNQPIQVAGLHIEDPLMNMMFVQRYRGADGQEWQRANTFSTRFVELTGREDAQGWFRHHPVITQLIAEEGVLGIPGLEPEPLE